SHSLHHHSLYPASLFSRLRPPPSSTLFPYTTLFRSRGCQALRAARIGRDLVLQQAAEDLLRVLAVDRDELVSDLEGERARLDRRSEEHTSELQSRFDLVCRLLLEKKKK